MLIIDNEKKKNCCNILAVAIILLIFFFAVFNEADNISRAFILPIGNVVIILLAKMCILKEVCLEGKNINEINSQLKTYKNFNIKNYKFSKTNGTLKIKLLLEYITISYWLYISLIALIGVNLFVVWLNPYSAFWIIIINILALYSILIDLFGAFFENSVNKFEHIRDDGRHHQSLQNVLHKLISTNFGVQKLKIYREDNKNIHVIVLKSSLKESIQRLLFIAIKTVGFSISILMVMRMYSYGFSFMTLEILSTIVAFFLVYLTKDLKLIERIYKTEAYIESEKSIEPYPHLKKYFIESEDIKISKEKYKVFYYKLPPFAIIKRMLK